MGDGRIGETAAWVLKLGEAGVLAAAWAFMHLTRMRTRTHVLGKEITTALETAFAAADASEIDTVRMLAEALGNAGDPRAATTLVTGLSSPHPVVREAVVEALKDLGNSVAVSPLLSRLDDPSQIVRERIVKALGRLGDKAAVEPLLTRLNDPIVGFRRNAVEALGQIGDNTAVAPLIAKLDDPDASIRLVVVEVLRRFGDQAAITALLDRLALNDDDQATIASALHVLREPRGTEALRNCLCADIDLVRTEALGAYAHHRDSFDRSLLSRDLDQWRPWLDPIEVITEERVRDVAERLDLAPAEIRSRYEAMAQDIGLKLAWQAPE